MTRRTGSLIIMFVHDFTDVQCAATMQSNCQKMKLPFEVLIQGPSGNRFIRSLIHADPNYENLFEAAPEERKTRSTISIYRPAEDEAEQHVQNLEPEVQNIEPEQSNTNDQLAEDDDIVTMVHQPQAEPLTAASDAAEHVQQPQAEPLTVASEAAEDSLTPIEASDDELSLDDISEEPKSAGSKREAVYDIDQDVGVDTLVEESALQKRDTEDPTDLGAAKVIVQPTPAPTPAPPAIPAKQNLVRDAVNRAKARAETLKETASAQRAQATELINNAIENVRNKLSNLPTLAPKPALPAPSLPPKPVFKNWFNKDPNVGSIQTVNLVPVKNLLPLQVSGLNNRVVLNPNNLLPQQNALQTINNNIAVRKAAAQAAATASKATLNAGLLPVVSIF